MCANLGMCFDRTFPPGLVTEFARRLDDGGADQLWIVEDCFYTAGISLAATALAVTERISVGLGILPAVARNPAITAMEIATLCGLAPGRVLPGIGHGVQSWMGQMGVRTASPLTSLEEVLVAVRRLLEGEEVSTSGQYVRLDGVRLDQPPADVPPLLAGVQGPKSLAMAGRAAGGVVLAEPANPTYLRWALEQAGRAADFRVAVFAALHVDEDRHAAYREMAPMLAEWLDEDRIQLRMLPFFDDLAARYADKGVDGLATMPSDWWTEIAPVGTLDDAAAHIAALEAAGAHDIGLSRTHDVETARSHLDHITSASRAADSAAAFGLVGAVRGHRRIAGRPEPPGSIGGLAEADAWAGLDRGRRVTGQELDGRRGVEEVGAVRLPADAEGKAHPGRASCQLPVLRRGTPAGASQVEAVDHLAGAEQDRRWFAVRSAGDVHAEVHPVREVDVEVTRWAEHHRIAGRRAAVGV